MAKNKKQSEKAWVLTVDMGYGHQRAAYPLNNFAQGKIICANNYPGIPERDKQLWVGSRKFYEFISRFKKVPLVGEKAFEIFDNLQAIPKFYPKRDLSKSNIQLKEIYNLFAKADWGRHLIAKLSRDQRPLVTTFFVTAFMAEHFKYEGDIFCVICDADISRTWAPLKPQSSRIIYLASNRRVVERLKLYGVRPSRIFFTGFPLPEENVGQNLKTIKTDLGRRLIHLDPGKIYLRQYGDTVTQHLGRQHFKKNPSRPLAITFAVGGAGAQRELGVTIMNSLKKEISQGQVGLNLVAGSNEEVFKYFKTEIKKAGLSRRFDQGVQVVFAPNKNDYFKIFNKVLRQTDILWTKPSELSFYCALGLPIIMAPPIGSQEIFNRKWLTSIGAGIDQEDPRYANEWLKDWLDSGWLAEAAMQGFLEAPKFGTYNIRKIIFHHFKEAKKVQTVLQY